MGITCRLAVARDLSSSCAETTMSTRLVFNSRSNEYNRHPEYFRLRKIHHDIGSGRDRDNFTDLEAPSSPGGPKSHQKRTSVSRESLLRARVAALDKICTRTSALGPFTQDECSTVQWPDLPSAQKI